MAVVRGMLTTIGGWEDRYASLFNRSSNSKNALLSIKPGNAANWKEEFPAMPTGRYHSAAFTVENYLVVAGGEIERLKFSDAVEILDVSSMQWSTASSLLAEVNNFHSEDRLGSPSVTICGGCVYIYNNKATVFSCSVKDLLDSASSNSGYGAVVWSRLPEIPGIREGAE